MDGQIKQPEIVAHVIKNLLSEANITTKQAAISLGGPSVIIKKIQLTSMTELELEDQISLEAEEYIPFDIDEVYLDFQILSQDTEQMDVLLTACKKELINNHLETINQAGLIPKICDLDLFCIANAYQTFVQPKRVVTKNSEEETIVLVNIGSSFLNITILQNGVPGYIRDHTPGCRHVIQECQQRYGISKIEAEQLPFIASQTGASTSELLDFQTEVITPFLEQVTQQIGQSISFHQSSNPNQPVTRVSLSGGGALFPNSVSFIHDRLDIPVDVADPLLQLANNTQKKGESSIIPSLPQNASPRLMVALGLALRGNT